MRLSARSIAEFGERHYGGPELDDSSTCQTHRPDYEPFSFLRRKKRRKITPVLHAAMLDLRTQQGLTRS